MKKTLIISGLLLSCFMATNADAVQSAKEKPDASRTENRFFLSFLADMNNPDDDRVHWADNRTDKRRDEQRKENDWQHDELNPAQSQLILDRMSDRLFLNREQKRQIYIILTDWYEPAGKYRGHGKWTRSEYIRYMKWKRRQMDRKICQVLTGRQKEIYFEMKDGTTEFAARVRRQDELWINKLSDRAANDRPYKF